MDKVSLLDTHSGCSTYTRRVLVEARNEGGETGIRIDGRFLWDCAAHDMPQQQAAQELGYKCLIDFPQVNIPVDEHTPEN